MSKPLVERYEQILAQDPASTVFIELAKALIEKSDLDRAIDVCQKGLEHHPTSVVGRVLWGKALIQQGRPAEAMEQFDQAIGIDRENAHAYNLIGEVLLKKGLFRSALPLLKKAVALQPNDGRVRQWLEQTQKALSGGPPPSLADVPDSLAPTGEEPPIPEPKPAIEPVDAPDWANQAMERTLVGAPPTRRPQDEVTDPSFPAPDLERTRPITNPNIPVLTPLGAVAAPATNPARRTGEVPVLTPSTRATGEHPAVGTAARITGEHRSLRPMVDVPQGATGEFPAAKAPGSPELEPLAPEERTLVNGASAATPPADAKPARRELLGDLDLPPGDDEPAEPTIVAPPPQARRTVSQEIAARGLLDEIPEEQPSPLLDVPKVEMSASAAKALADQYEKDLRQKMAEKAAEKTFLQRHGVKLAFVTVLTVAAGVGLLAYWHTQSVNRGKTLRDNLVDARRLLNQDTETAYRDSLKVLEHAVQMDESSEEAWALTGYARALLFAEHGARAEDKAAGTAALGKPRVEQKFPQYALTAHYYLADSKARDGARQSVLASSLDNTEVQELAGRLLLGQKNAKAAVEHFKRALSAFPNNVRALVALGNYFREAGDSQQALQFYTTAAPVSPQHPERVIGGAECRLELGTELEEGLKDVEALPASLELSPDLLARKELAYGRLLAANGQADKAIKRLTEGVKGFRTRAFEFNLALGDAYRAGGDLDGAQRSYEAALKGKPSSEEAKEMIGRVLIQRDREHEALSRLNGESGRKVALVRGIAWARLADWKKVRTELSKTQVNGKYPAESVIYLALADAAEGQEDKAQDILEKTLAASKKAKSDLRVALGQVYWRKGTLDRARNQFEEAARDPLDFEGPCSLGRLKLSQGDVDEAIEKLKLAVSRNGSHGEARHALSRAYLMTGKADEALKQANAWQADNPNAAAALKDAAMALRELGKSKDAEVAINRSVRLDSSDSEAHRVRSAILYARGDPKGALSELERANKMNPHDADTFCEIGHAFVRQGKNAAAGKAFEAARREDPKSACAAIGMLLIRLPSGAKPASRELADLGQRAPMAWDRGQALAALARAHMAAGQLKEARKSAEDAVRLEPELANGHYALGLIAWKQKDDAKAKEELIRAEELEPAHAGIHLALADLLSRPDGDLNRAFTEYGLFIRTSSNAPEVARVKRMLPLLKKKLAAR